MTTTRKLVATGILLATIVAALLLAFYNPCLMLLVVIPAMTILAVVIRGLDAIWRRD